MATSEQARLGQYGVYRYERGEFFVTNGSKKKLVECPLCAADPTRPRHEFSEQSKRAVHFRDAHDASEI